MAIAADRRTLLRMALGAAIAPAFASRAEAGVPAVPTRFDPPVGPMAFTRRLVRNLGDGNRLTVERRFAVHFARQPSGWTVAGEQVDVAVDFPERLAALAALERQRVETALFPLLLDGSGAIVGGPEARPARELDEAVAMVRRDFAMTAHSTDELKAHEAFVRAVHDAGTRMTSLLPPQLFAPGGHSAPIRRNLALPDGGHGTIEVSFTAVADPITGLMRRAQRDIVTTIAADSRLTREEWTLAPA